MKSSEIKETTLFFMLAHHDQQHLDRCLRISFKTREIFLCARCAGILFGFLTQLILLSTTLTFDSFTGNFLLFILPLPSITDWVTQRLGYRESLNVIRVSTGVLLGSDFAYRLLRSLSNFLDLYVLLTSALYLFTVFIATSISIKRFGEM